MPSSCAPSIRYGLLPALTAVALLGAYFSGVGPLMNFVAPPKQREYGVLENLQNLFLILIAVAAWRAARRERAAAPRIAARALAVLSVVVLMEELDWGDHYFRSIAGRRYIPGAHFNLHNQGDARAWIRRLVDLGGVVGFVVAPLFLQRRIPARLRPWIPDSHSFLTLLVGMLASKSARLLEGRGWPNNQGLRSNYSEFRELFVYWLAWLYVSEVIRRRRLAPGLLVSPNPEPPRGEDTGGPRPPPRPARTSRS